ncbi:MAG: metal-sensitive transcriptional regulator [Symbiobacterium sp.]|uniref:metal-sensitive transcriptional regulator n=1 Tax=Symbiobacterium sp. TaxID=1971213 RepID=UPI00346472D0
MSEKRPGERVPLVRDRQGILDRLKKIEGQVRGLQRMVEEDRYCVDILNQVAAVEAALNKVSLMLLEGHAKGCMAAAVRRGEGDEAVEELMQVLGRFLR